MARALRPFRDDGGISQADLDAVLETKCAIAEEQAAQGEAVAEAVVREKMMAEAMAAQREARVTAAELVTARDAKGWIPVMYADFQADRLTVLALLRHAPWVPDHTRAQLAFAFELSRMIL